MGGSVRRKVDELIGQQKKNRLVGRWAGSTILSISKFVGGWVGRDVDMMISKHVGG